MTYAPTDGGWLGTGDTGLSLGGPNLIPIKVDATVEYDHSRTLRRGKTRSRVDHRTAYDIENIIKRCSGGEFDDDEAPARIHGDLWGGNVMWTSEGAVLIDPAAHGGHRETDLAMLHLFGCPHLVAIIDGYQEVHPLQAGWRNRIGLHQLYPLLGHVVLFGGGYARQVARAARSALEIS